MTQAASTNVFLTWSGERSKAMATALRNWLPSVIQAINPWMSDSDIAKGAGWNSEISKQLELAKIGIVCLTPENLDAPWVNFEAGALSKLTGSKVCTYLFGLSPSDVKGPLAQFQTTKSDDKDDTKKLLHTINKSLGEQLLKDTQVDIAFEKWWPDLDRVLKVIPHAPIRDQRPKRTQEDLLEEILQLSREQEKTSNATLQTLQVLTATATLEQYRAVHTDNRFGFGGNVSSFFSPVIVPGTGSLRINAADSISVSTEEVAQLAALQAKQKIAAIAAETDSKNKDENKVGS